MSARRLAVLNMLFHAEQEDLREERRSNEARAHERKKRRCFMDPVKRLTEAEFRRRYRLSKEAFLYLSEEVGRYTDLHSSQRISRDLKILTALSFYQSGSNQRGVGEGRHLSQAAVSNYVKEVTSALNHPDLVRHIIKFPTTPEERQAIKQRFYRRFGLPGVIGAIDASHVRIYSPKRDIRHVFYCRKNFYSLNVQVVCDDKCRILAVNPKYGGATHDAFIWEFSALNPHMQALHRTDPTCWLLGDSGYPLRPWLMTPYTDAAEGSPEADYTRVHGQARVVVENTLGRMKNRWRCCIGDRPLHYAPEKCAQIVVACCVLHNIALDFGVPEPDDQLPEVEEFRRPEIVEEQSGSMELLRGQANRNQIVRQLAQARP